ncbi:GHKL domain-containing protein [Paenibacillaceae bacterium GAS479]|nr:GHKL domain-containing protein [Paenibacillaceae bacterium GAS479]
MIYVQVLLDTFIMLFLCYALAGHSIGIKRSVILWFLWFHGLCLFLRIRLSSNSDIFAGLEVNNFDLLPVNNPIYLNYLLFGVAILNSTFIRPLSNMKVVVVTLLSLQIWILLRTFSIAATGLFFDIHASSFPYFQRILTILLATILYYVLIIKRGTGFLANFSGVFTKIMLIQSSLAVLAIIVYSNFETTFVLENLWFILIVFSLVISMNIWIIYEQNKRSRQETRFSAIEQYLPVIDDLVSEVRARQHEFHNKLLAIHSIVETSLTLPEARSQITAYTKDIMMQIDVREILQIDSKVIGGFLYTKMKMAELKKMTLTTRIHALFSPMATDEHQILEIIGVLVDNAIEASFPGDEIILFVQRAESDSMTEISVLNPFAHRSNTEFMQMFAMGHTTKNIVNGSRGYGLYNVQQIVAWQKGRILTRNTERSGVSYISIGVLIP